MANLTRAEIADRALEALGVLAAGQDASAEDANRALEAVDAVYYRLRKEGLAPFAISAVPEWAQTQLIHLIAWDLVPTFGVGGLRFQLLTTAVMGPPGASHLGARAQLIAQCAAFKPSIPIQTESF